MFRLWNTKWQPTISLYPSLIKALTCWSFLWLDQSFDLCCQVTFPDPTGASRVGTLAGAPGNYLDSGVVGGCHWALVFLMSPLTPASVAIAREIWRPCWAVNNRIYLPVFDHHCHLCSYDEMFPCLSSGVMCSSCLFQGTKRGVRGQPWERAVDKVAQLAVPGAPMGPRVAWSGESRTLKDDKGQLEKRRTLPSLSRHYEPQSTVRDTKWCSVSSPFPCVPSPRPHRTHCKFVFAFVFFVCMKCTL